MRKHLWKVLTALAVVCMTIGVAAACGPDEPEPPVMYALTYVGGEGATGTAPEAESYAEGDTVTLKANPFAKEGYDFKAWSFGGTEYQPAATFTMPASNVTFTATWTEKPQIEPAEQFTLTYSLGDYTGGTAPTALTVETGTEVTLATPPAWAEHTFAGWKIGTETLQAGAKYTVTGNVTATAQWTLVTYAVTFDLDGGEMDPAPTQAATAKDGTFTLPATEPTKDGFHFAGWSDGTTTYEKGATYTMPGAAVKFTAQWTAVTHAELVGGYWVGSFTQGEGDEAVLTSVICVINPYETPTEVEMDEETVALKVGRSLFKAKMTVGDVTLYNTAMVQEFYWLEEEGLYTNGNVAFKVIDGALAFLTPEPMDEAPSDAKFTAMTRITAPAVPEFPASLYGRVEDDLHSPFTQIAITKDSETGTIGITLNGKEQKIEWFGDIAYLTESTAGATASVVGGTLYSETVEPEEEDGDPVTTFYLIPPEDEDVIVLAEGPAPTLYKVELYRNKADTSAYTTYYVEKNAKLENLDIAQDENYTFVGWADKETDEIVDLTDITKDLAVYEKWSVKPVHVEFDWGDGTFTGDAPAAEFDLDDATLAGGDHWDIDLTEYNEVQLDDNTFNGWTVVVRSRDGSSSSNSLSKDRTSYTVYLGTQSVTFTAIFAQNDECVVTFRDQHGNQTAKTLKRGEQLGDALQDPDPCIGYVFKEWNTQPDGEGVTVTAETIVPDWPEVIYYAIWEENVWTLTFIFNDGTEAQEVVKVIKTEAIGSQLPTCPPRAGYDFDGWSETDGGDVVELTAETVPEADKTYYGHWTEIVYSVEFYANEEADSASTTKQASHGEQITLDEVSEPSVKNYHFAYWYYKSGEEEVQFDVSMAPSDILTDLGLADPGERTLKLYAKMVLDETIDIDDVTADTYTFNTPLYVYPETIKPGQVITIMGDLAFTRDTPAAADGVLVYFSTAELDGTSAPLPVIARYDRRFNGGDAPDDDVDKCARMNLALAKHFVGFSVESKDWFAEYTAMTATKNISAFEAELDYSNPEVLFISYILTAGQQFTYDTEKDGTQTVEAGTQFIMRYGITSTSGALGEYHIGLGGEKATLTNATATRKEVCLHQHLTENVCDVCGKTFVESGKTDITFDQASGWGDHLKSTATATATQQVHVKAHLSEDHTFTEIFSGLAILAYETGTQNGVFYQMSSGSALTTSKTRLGLWNTGKRLVNGDALNNLDTFDTATKQGADVELILSYDGTALVLRIITTKGGDVVDSRYISYNIEGTEFALEVALDGSAATAEGAVTNAQWWTVSEAE